MFSGPLFPHDPRHTPEDAEAVANERRKRMGRNHRLNPWERRLLAAIGAVVAVGVIGGVVWLAV